MFALLSFAPGAVITSASLARCNAMLDLAYVSSSYDDRLIIGRKAQLGEEMIYRSGLNIDSTLTYGEFDLNLFASLVDRALMAWPMVPHLLMLAVELKLVLHHRSGCALALCWCRVRAGAASSRT